MITARCGGLLLLFASCANLVSAQTNGAVQSRRNEALTLDLGAGVKMEFILIHPGAFAMGSDKIADERPAHNVTIAKPFYFGKYLVTQVQWENVMGANPSVFHGATNPVDSVSWNDCQKFVAKLSEKLPGKIFRLPTEAEWEYACRAGSHTEYSFGDSETALMEFAWDRVNSGARTHPVGGKAPNAWGLYDMQGNVWEWCQDLWHPSYSEAPTNENAWIQDGDVWYRVVRGGSWNNYGPALRAARRARNLPSLRLDFYGVRLVLAVDTP